MSIRKTFFFIVTIIFLFLIFALFFDYLPNQWKKLFPGSRTSISLDTEFSQPDTEPSLENQEKENTELGTLFSEFSQTSTVNLAPGVIQEDLIKACSSDQEPCSRLIANATEFEPSRSVEWLQPTDRVFVYKSKDQNYIFPKGILAFHVVVNTQIDGEQLFVSYSPYTGAARAYVGKINNRWSLFKWSGYFYKSSPVLQDAIEGNLWSQLTGKPLSLLATEQNWNLEPRALVDITWQQSKIAFPNGIVMTRNTGYEYDYTMDQYEKDLESDTILFSRTFHKHPVSAKTWVYAFQVLGKQYAIREKDLPQINKETTIDILFNGKNLSLKNTDGVISVEHPFNTIYPVRVKWFAWLAEYPLTKLTVPVQ